MSVMSESLEKAFELCIERGLESRYEDDKIHINIMNLKGKVLREMAEKERRRNIPETQRCSHCKGSGYEPLLRDEAEVLKDKLFHNMLSGGSNGGMY